MKVIYLSLGCLFAVVSFFIQQNTPINIDVSLHLDVATKILQGKKLYQDILLTNLPFVYYLRVVVVKLSYLAHLDVISVSNLVNTLIVLFAFTIAAKNLFRIELEQRKETSLIILVSLSYIFFLKPALVYQFGQKEHLITVFLMPYLLLFPDYFTRKEKPKFDFSYVLLSFALCIKPHYIFIWIFTELLYCLRANSIKTAFNINNLILVLIGSFYLAYILIFTKFYSNIIPLSPYYFYFNYSSKITVFFFLLSKLYLLIFTAVFYFLLKFKPFVSFAPGQQILLNYLFCVIMICLIAVMMQGQTEGSAVFVITCLSIIFSCLALNYIYRTFFDNGDFAKALLILFAIYITAVIGGLFKQINSGNISVNPDMEKLIDEYAADKKVNEISFFFPLYPLAVYKKLDISDHYYHLWPLSGLYNMKYFKPGFVDSDALQKVRDDTINTKIDDLKSQNPSLLLVSIADSPSSESPLKINQLEEFSRYPAFNEFMKNYRLLKEMENYNVYVRKN